jgi:hypothetical protein
MTTLFDSRLSDRDYASYLLHVGDLVKWVESKRLHLQAAPDDMYEFVQVEALLSAIERHANNVTPEQALNIVLNDPVLKNDPVIQKYPDDIDPITCRWLLGAEAHRKWRELLYSAISAGELTLLDFGSKLPVNIAPTESTATPAPAPVVAEGAYIAQPKQRTQEIRILELLTTNSYDPLKLEQRQPGKPGPKAEIRTLAMNEPALFSKNSFDKAWERLRGDGSVAGAD